MAIAAPNDPVVQKREQEPLAGTGRLRFTVDAIPPAALVIFFAVLFREALFRGRFFLIGDPLKQLYPLRMIAWNMIRDGTLPLWTPHILSGYPMGAMAMLGIGYPISWGYLVLPGHWAEQLYILAPYLLAPIFTYAFLRESGRSAVASMLGGLVFGYSGFLFSPIGFTGVHTNSALWLPLLLLGIARARRASFVSSLMISTAAYTLSILAGSGQIFLYVGSLALAYGAWLLFAGAESGRRRWQPPAVAAGSLVLSAGVTAFQSLETWNAVGLSVRRAYPFERFSEGSYSASFAVRSLLQPLGNFWDSSTYVPLLALGLAFVAVRRPRANAQVIFWLFVALVAWLLVLGNNTRFFSLYSYLPLVGRFRYPSRHSLEWTFAIAVLAAYGWDAIEGWIRRRKPVHAVGGIGVAVFVLLSVIAAGQWAGVIVTDQLDRFTDLNHTAAGLSVRYLTWKVAFTFAIALAAGITVRMTHAALRTTLLASILGLYCYVEPHLWLVRPLLVPSAASRQQFGSLGEATRVVRWLRVENERTFSVVGPYTVPAEPKRDIDAVNWTALAGFHDINGYESLIMQRYISALRGVTGEVFDTEPFINRNLALFDPKSHILDLLNVRFVIAYTDLCPIRAGRIEKDGIAFSTLDLGISLPRHGAFGMPGGDMEADTLALVTSLNFAVNIAHGTPVARLTIYDPAGRKIERHLRAGIDTADWVYDRADVLATVPHGRAPVFDSSEPDPVAGHRSHRFLGKIDLGERFRVAHVEITNIAEEADIELAKASLYDSATRRSEPLPRLSPPRWQPVHDKNGVVVFMNMRPLPRAWLVTNVEAAERTEILRRLIGASDVAFDPRSTALVEMRPDQVPPLDGGPLSPDSYARIRRHEPSRLIVETHSPQRTMLVLSENFYPGWVARVDGAATQIRQTNYLLRGVFLAPGTHTVEMMYTAPGARIGALISLATVMLTGISIIAARKFLR